MISEERTVYNRQRAYNSKSRFTGEYKFCSYWGLFNAKVGSCGDILKIHTERNMNIVKLAGVIRTFESKTNVVRQ